MKLLDKLGELLHWIGDRLNKIVNAYLYYVWKFDCWKLSRENKSKRRRKK